MTDQTLCALRQSVDRLRAQIETAADQTPAGWRDWIATEAYLPSAENFAHYLALRRHDIRPLQRELMRHGLSSLGRIESRVLPTLDAIRAVLSAATDGPAVPVASGADFFAGEARISARADRLLGRVSPHSPVRLLVTMPSLAADDPGFVRQLCP
ncbi:hypothetical protein [Nioella nitratireducens]|uniref:hypothetical protein n=1 Tax=Nioella nitratireducens TaxID=1287720 RepID=UPI0008FD4918|nr:hypothetical protein [Nioella nitratireducens]